MSKNENLRMEFEIPTGVYYPGQEINGYVYFQTDKVYKARALKLKFDGRAHTTWEEEEEFKRQRSNGKTQYDRQMKNYAATVIYVEHEILLWTAPDGSNELPIGKYTWPFSYKLPMECAPSFESDLGSIRYFVEAEFDRPWRIDDAEKKTIVVCPYVDLNSCQKVFQCVSDQSVEDIGCCFFTKGYVDLKVNMPKRGFVPGETLSMNVDINNRSRIPVQRQTATLYQRTRYVAFRDGETHRYDSLSGVMNALSIRESKDEQKEVARTSLDVLVPPGTSHKVEIQLVIPSVTPNISSICPIIALDYLVKVDVDTDSSCSNKNECDFEIMIGTVPINQYIPPPLYPSVPPSNILYRSDEKPQINEDGTVIIPSAPLMSDEDRKTVD